MMSVWLNYQAARMRLYRELGVLRLDAQGLWNDEPLEKAVQATVAGPPLPPEVPDELMALASDTEATTAESEATHGNRKEP